MIRLLRFQRTACGKFFQRRRCRQRHKEDLLSWRKSARNHHRHRQFRSLRHKRDGTATTTAPTAAPTAKLYHSFEGQLWNEGAAVTMTEDKLVHFIAVDLDALASEIVSRSFKKRPVGRRTVTANVNSYFLAGSKNKRMVSLFAAIRSLSSFYPPFGRWRLGARS